MELKQWVSVKISKKSGPNNARRRLFQVAAQGRRAVSIASGSRQDMFPGVSIDDIGVWPADGGQLVVSVRGGGAN